MTKWGYATRELHLDNRNDFIFYWYDNHEYLNESNLLKKLRAFFHLENISIDDSEDDLLRMLVNSSRDGKFIKFSVYDNLSYEEISIILKKCAKSVWENFALIDIDELEKHKSNLRKIVGPTIDRRNEQHQFYLKWGFKKFW